MNWSVSSYHQSYQKLHMDDARWQPLQTIKWHSFVVFLFIWQIDRNLSTFAEADIKRRPYEAFDTTDLHSLNHFKCIFLCYRFGSSEKHHRVIRSSQTYLVKTVLDPISWYQKLYMDDARCQPLQTIINCHNRNDCKQFHLIACRGWHLASFTWSFW